MKSIDSATVKNLQKILGKQNVLQDEVSIALNAYDCSLSRFRPDIILNIPAARVLPEVIRILAQAGIPFTARAAASNHAGSCATLYGGAVLNLNPLNRILKIDTDAGFAEVEPAVINEHLQMELDPLGFFYAPDPASERICTLGGNLAQNASGARCMKYGNTLDHVLDIHFITPDGARHTFKKTAPGPSLIGLVSGSEGTLGIIESLKVRILPKPAYIKTFLVTFHSLEDSVQTVSDLVASGILPRCVEAMDKVTTKAVEGFARAGYPTDCEALLIIELDGTPAQMKKETAVLEKVCKQNNCASWRTAKDEAERQKLWYGRRSAYAAMARLAPNVMVGDGTVPRSELPKVLKKVREILSRENIYASLLFHAGDGNLHPQIIFNEQNKIETQTVTRALKEILKACVDCGGTISGEHGIGVEKRSVMAYQYDRETLRLFSKIKKAFDPANLSNPGKLLPVDFQDKAAGSKEQNPAILKLAAEIKKRSDFKIPSLILGKASRLKKKGQNALSTLTLHHILEIDKTNYTAAAEAGVTLSALSAELSKNGVYAVLPKTGGTLGGLIAGKTFPAFENQLLGIQAILPNGDIVTYGGKLMKNAAGYNLNRLFFGSQGAFGLITKATFKIYAAAQKAERGKTSFEILKPTPLLQALKKQIDPQNLFNPFIFGEEND